MSANVTTSVQCASLDDFYKKANDTLLAKDCNAHYALASIDIDNFNFINDLFGYDMGDTLLFVAENHFSKNLSGGEFFSRIQGDHFVFLVYDSPGESVLSRFYKWVDSLSERNPLPVHYQLVCSGGIVAIDNAFQDIRALMDKANFARKLAKGNNSSTFLLYDKKMEEDLYWKKSITFAMTSALYNHEFEMHLQPKVLMRTGQLVGAEALARWNSKTYGMIYPDRFIPVLEQNGFVKQLDFYILEQACLLLNRFRANDYPVLPISVNFSKIHLRTDNFVEKVYETVNSHGVPADLIEIELTENIFSDDYQRLIDVTSSLKRLGFRVSLDDFGSAYSSLNYLKDLPLDVIKIDKGFLNASANNDKGRLIIAKVIEMIKSMSMISVMEGVETEEEVNFLQNLSCDLGQGYFYAKPMPVAQYEQFVQNAEIAD